MTPSPTLEKDSRHVWHPYTPIPHRGPKAVFTRAQGAFLYDEQGKRYFDATSSWWCNVHGHCHPRLVEALSRQAGRLDQILFSPHTHPVAVELAEALLQKLGSPFHRVFYSDDGSTAVECALKMALQYWANLGEPSRDRFLSLEKAYHGDTLGAVGVSHVDQFHRHFGSQRPRELAVPVPGRDRTTVQCLEVAQRVLGDHGDRIAALIVEPLVLGAGGMIFYPPEFLDGLVALCREEKILVIFDEVFTGFGRTGTFFAMDQVRLRPDIVCLSKGLTSGMLPLAVTATSEAIYEAFSGGEEKTFYHGHTFTANALGCAVALESLKIWAEEAVLERNQKTMELMAAQGARFRDLPRVREVRQLGMIWVAELVLSQKPGTVTEPANAPGWRIAQALWEQGIHTRPLNNILYLLPPYCSAESELQRFFSVLYSELLNDTHF